MNDRNVVVASGFSDPNAWSRPPVPGPNIVGGPSLGGNFYGTPAGDGFSQTCADADGDGFCDAPNPLASNNVDAFPLVRPVDDGGGAGLGFPPGFFVDSRCTGVLTVGTSRVAFAAGFEDGDPTVSRPGPGDAERLVAVALRFVDTNTLTNLELDCTVEPTAEGREPSRFDFDLAAYEDREVAVCVEQRDGSVTCFEGPVDEDGWHPVDAGRVLLLAFDVFVGNTPVDATFFPGGLPGVADGSDDSDGSPDSGAPDAEGGSTAT